MSVIAIFSGVYSSAEEIAQRVADELGYALIGQELLDDAASRFDTTTKKLARALSGDRGIFDGMTHESDKAIVYLKAALAERLKADDLVYLGPATHLIPRTISHVLRVAIVADRSYRVPQAVAAGVGAEEATKRIHDGDRELSQWTHQLFGLGAWDASLYDIKIPLPQNSVDRAVELILHNVRKDALRTTDRSVKAVLDFLLSCQVSLALLERGHPYCDVRADGDSVSVVINKKTGGAGKLARTVRALRYEQAEDEVRETALAVDGVESVETRPGAGFRRRASTLLVDDERDYVMTLSERLQLRDIESDVAYDGEQALSALDEDEPRVMVLDLRMPGMDGIEVLRRVKRDHPDVEVIIVTGHGSEKDEQMARELGAFDYLKKPVDINVLAATMERAQKKASGGE
jgi:CheY-like chemotaxis protein